MTKITSTTSTQTATPTIPVEAAEPATKPKADIAPSKKECAPESPPKDTWETGKEEKSEGFFSKLGQKIDQTIDDAKSTVKSAGETIQKTVEDVQQTVKSAGETVKKAASDAVNDGIDTIQQRANNAVDNLQQGIDNVQKNVNETIDALQTLDAKTVKDIAVKHFVDEPIQTVKDVATVASKAIEMQQEIKKQQHEAISKIVVLAFEKAPEILEAAQTAAESFIENTHMTLEKYARPVIEETLKDLEQNTRPYIEGMERLVRDPEALAQAALEATALVGATIGDLKTELMILGADVVAKNEKFLSAYIDFVSTASIPLPQVEILKALKDQLPEGTIAHSLIDIISRGGIVGVAYAQMRELGADLARKGVETAVYVSENSDKIREMANIKSSIINLGPNEEWRSAESYQLDGHVKFGGGASRSSDLTAKPDEHNPNDIILTISSELAGKLGYGASAGGKGASTNLGWKHIDNVELRFDRTDPNQLKDMEHLIDCYRGGLAKAGMTFGLDKYINKINITEAVTIDGKATLFDLGAEQKRKLEINPKDQTVKTTISGEVSARLGIDGPHIQLPKDITESVNSTLKPTSDPLIRDILDSILGKNNDGLNAEVKLTIEAGATFATANNVTLDNLESIFIEFKGSAHANSHAASASLKFEIHQPVELAKLIGTNAKDLALDFQSGKLTLDELSTRLNAVGKDLKQFVSITIPHEVRRSDDGGFKMNAHFINLESMKYKVISDTLEIFPPETPAAQLTQNDAAAAELRLLDRAFHA